VIKQEDGSKPAGTVLAQSPKGGVSAVKGTLVTITVATAPPPPPPTTPPPSTSATPTVSPSPTTT
jgi:serine/threonine-protein kinase